MLLQHKGLKRFSAHGLALEPTPLCRPPRALDGRSRRRNIRLVVLEPQLGLEAHDALPRDEQAAPVACLCGRREVTVAKDAYALLGDGPRLRRPRKQPLDLFLQVREVALYLHHVLSLA